MTRKVLLPLMNREIPIITDDILANPEFGTGAVKVTPSHDPNDFEAGLRNSLPQIEIMNDVAQMNENAGPYQGLDRLRRASACWKTWSAAVFSSARKITGAAGKVPAMQLDHRAAALDAMVCEDSAARRPRD